MWGRKVANSNQTVETPWSFVKAVEKHFGIEFEYDMACSSENRKAPYFITEDMDSLSIDWPLDGWLWLNPPFRHVGAWAKKCLEQMERGCKIVSIWPLSYDNNMIETWGKACVSKVNGRIWPEVRTCQLGLWDKSNSVWSNGLHWDRKVGTLTEVEAKRYPMASIIKELEGIL